MSDTTKTIYRMSDAEVKDFWDHKLFNIDRPHHLQKLEYNSIPEAWEYRVSISHKRVGFICLDQKYTFDELDILSDKFAVSLLKKKYLNKGDRIAIMMPNTVQYFIALMGVLKAGLTVVNCNPLYTKEEISRQVRDSGAKILVTLENVCLAPAEAMNEGLMPSIQEVIITKLGDKLPGFKKYLVNFVVKHVKKMVPKYSFPKELKVTKFLDMFHHLSSHDNKTLNDVEKSIKLEDVAFLQYTGGTTGVSKGAILTHKNILINTMQAEYSLPRELEKKMLERMSSEGNINCHALLPLPFYHIYALSCGLFTLMINYGMAASTLPNPRDLKALIKLFHDEHIILAATISTLAKALVKNEDFKKVKLRKSTVIIAGGMPTEKEIADEWNCITGTHITEGYGMTETSPLLSINDVHNPEAGRAGYPVPETLFKLRDDDGNDLPLGHGPDVKGELLVKGPQMMSGYYNHPEENAAIFTDDGYIATGDIATVSKEGIVDIVDRKKDMILVSGFNVYPSEIEEKALKTGLLLECAAIAVPDKKTGEKVVLVAVALDKDKKDEKLVLDMLSKELTNYKRPSEVIFMEALPKTPVGKVLKKELRAMYSSIKKN